MNKSSKSNIKGLILDMDGVIWKDENPIGNIERIFNTIIHKGLRFILCTNNSTLNVEKYQQKLNRFGVKVQDSQIITSSIATAEILKSLLPTASHLFIIGESGLVTTLEEAGFINSDTDIKAVVVGLDRELTYSKLKKAALLIRNGAKFIGTNPDRTLPTPEGLIPGAGTIISALQTATEITPIIVGKPQPYMMDIALKRLGLQPKEVLVIGDRIDTDIVAGQLIGCKTALVLSGVSTRTDLQKLPQPPDYVAENLEALINEYLTGII